MNNQGENKNLGDWFEDFKPELLSYINRRTRLFRLDAYEKASMAASILGYGLIVFFIVVFALFFILLGLAFFVGEMLDSQAAGFGVMTLLSLFLLLIVYLFRRKIKSSILNHTIKIMRKIEADGEK